MARLVYGGYGHHPSGKQYVYWGSDNLRTGQSVVAPVTNWRTGKQYDTMFTIQRTTGSQTEMAKNEYERLDQSGIVIKSIGGQIMELPGAVDFSSASDWKRQSDAIYDQNIRARLMEHAKEPTDMAEAHDRLTLGRHKIGVSSMEDLELTPETFMPKANPKFSYQYPEQLQLNKSIPISATTPKSFKKLF